MKREHVINIGLAVLVVAAVSLVILSREFAGIVAILVRVLIMAAVVGLSAYKLTLWHRYRDDPKKREAVVYSTQIFPKRIRRLLMDEKGIKPESD